MKMKQKIIAMVGKCLDPMQTKKIKSYEMALLSIATMDVYTRNGEEPPHEVMRQIAKTELKHNKNIGD